MSLNRSVWFRAGVVVVLASIMGVASIRFIQFKNERSESVASVKGVSEARKADITFVEVGSVKPLTIDVGDDAEYEENEVSSVNLREEPKAEWSSESGRHEIFEFQRSRGHFSSDDIYDYHSYSLETLAELSEANDFIAAHVLASRLHEQGRRDEAYDAYMHAATLGSTAALGKLANFHNTSYVQNKNSTEEEREDIVNNMLTFYQVAQMRGDRSMGARATAFLKVHNIHLTDERRQEIANRGREMYDELNDSRASEGLDGFDNSIPENVQRY